LFATDFTAKRTACIVEQDDRLVGALSDDISDIAIF